MHSEHKYARIEWERRFLLEHFPRRANVTQVRRITDRYLDGTSLRLREQIDSTGNTVFKLTQKLPDRASGARQGWITTIYLTEDEFARVAKLPARMLGKTRHSIPPFGVDVFEGELRGLIIAEAEFSSAAEAAVLQVPSFIACEVSEDIRFTGGSLVNAKQSELKEWLEEYGIRRNQSDRSLTR